jgi:hypothetical protein
MKDPRKRIHVVTVQYNGIMAEPLELRSRCNFFVNTATLEKWVSRGGRSRAESGLEAGLNVPWEEWGPVGTRAMRPQSAFNWLRYVEGERVVLPATPLATTFLEVVRILDFNVHPKREWHASSLGEPTRDVHVQQVSEASTIPAGDIFEHDITTSLPYRMLSTTALFDYSGFMIDEERLIGLKVSSASYSVECSPTDG